MGSGLPIAAPVLEHLCLFTHDLKRKQKRWQDGRLKFHTFNKRIMVYDERGNFIGDMHWREDFDFGEGEEFNLERGAVIVQVAECIGSKEQDLTELLDKRAKEVEQRHARSAANTTNQPHPPTRPSVQHPQAQYRQRHLSDVFTTPRGPQGRAVIPTTSPYEDRVMAQQSSSPQDEVQRPTKRRRREVSPPSKSGYAQNLFGATLNLSSWSASAPVRSQPAPTPRSIAPSVEAPSRSVIPSKSINSSRPKPSTVVDLTNDAAVPARNVTASITCESEIPATSNTSVVAKEALLGHRPFKRPSTNVRRDISVERDMENIENPREVLSPRSRQSESRFEVQKQTNPRKGSRKSQDGIQKASTHGIDDRPDRGVIPEPAQLRAPATARREAPGIYEHLPENGSTSSIPAASVPERTLVLDDEAANPEEPKTKLRIKTREKRGLMVVAKKATTKTKRRQLSPAANRPNPSTSDGQTITDVTLSEPSPTTTPALPDESSLGHPTHDSYIEAVPKANAKAGKAKDHKQPDEVAKGLAQPEISDDEGRTSAERSLQPARTLRTRRARRSPDREDDVEQVRINPGPRLASLGRRTVKSKEIIGSFNTRPPRIALGTSAATAAPRREAPATTESHSEANSSFSKTSDGVRQAEATRPTKTTRLENPATRGRKAAQKSDAMGAVPEPVLPANLDAALGRNLSGASSRSEARTGAEIGMVASEPKKQLPGFQRANGGPWSKEAHDLMGCTRPG
ncbi:uncharacterized protein BDZ83DRAFT_567013 [Colletotrichum acutatum]|uniref:5'-3' DNA helicase ZGRF1-like N-terminal domain-containing protein n=1 Tax=Glomerella acutata TaxID=27357 RepID=A0AAD8XMS0_GLOAC|nr:uncharacterized protein BDZ83DRAFT_567013 [Colletotrichum acutatum]KAK1730204.1 hypothetical protein BDZ83DRAFT_567013 [Colletotrichum acutatum]